MNQSHATSGWGALYLDVIASVHSSETAAPTPVVVVSGHVSGPVMTGDMASAAFESLSAENPPKDGFVLTGETSLEGAADGHDDTARPADANQAPEVPYLKILGQVRV